ncbi:MAG: T9SS type A sorting domain-containing protein [Bacteroidetes bacterium]|nr:T9SS type A sorting domain-containing protein [Bacteroidota bacterium]
MQTHVPKFALGIIFLLPALGFSQEVNIQPCNTYAAMEEYFHANPQAKAAYEAKEKMTQKLYEERIANRNANANAAAKTTALSDYTIPVVFHVLHQYGVENVADQVCIDALAQLNRDFSRQGADTNLIFKPFKDGTYPQTPAGYIDSQIKFMLAHKDPQGKCTNGIVHHYDDRTNWHQANNGIGTPNNFAGITWTPSKYLNIIVVKNIIPQGSVAGGGIIVGYTYKPGTWATNAVQDAIVYRYDYLGGLQARTLAHELGHWLDLDHTFGNTNNPGVACGNDDGISDTPITRGNFGVGSACSVFTMSPPCFSSSTPFSQAPYFQNAENFMDYSNCPRNFTAGQTNKMQLTLSQATSGRNNLSTPENLTATDVDGTLPCALIADWISTNGSYTVCAGGALEVKDYSYNGMPVSWQWTGNNSATAASANSITTITFPLQGITTVTLTVTNSSGLISSFTRTVEVKNATPGITTAFTESFESGLPAGWSVVNPDVGTSEWTGIGDNIAYDGVSSFYVSGAEAGANQEDNLYLPLINMQTIAEKTFTFAYAYARASTSHNDVLKVQASSDCAATWADLAILNANVMQNGSGGIIEADFPYFPFSKEEWKVYHVNSSAWNQYKNSPTLLIRFNFKESSIGHGNNLFIDAVNIGGINTNIPDGLNKFPDKLVSLNLYPNPTDNEATLKFTLADASAIKINVIDVTGRVLLNVIDNSFTAGEHTISINKNNTLEQGIYFVNMTVNGKSVTQKLLVD